MNNRSNCETLSNEFATSDRTRGDSYFRNGRVAFRELDSDILVAKVRGSSNQPYTVEVELDEFHQSVNEINCSCPQFDRAGCCKHGWAVLRALDELIDGQPSTAASKGQKINAHSRDVVQYFKQAGKQVIDQRARVATLTDAISETSVGGGLVVPPVSRATKLPVPAWQLMLKSIQQAAGNASARQGNQRKSTGPIESLYYLLDVSLQNSDWPVITLYQQNAEIQRQPWYETTPATKCDLEDCACDLDLGDARILDELLNANSAEDDYYGDYRYSSRSRRRDIYRYEESEQFTIDDQGSPFLLLEIVRTGRCFWQVDRTSQPEPLPIKRFVSALLQPQLVLSDAAENQIRMSLQIPVDDQVLPVGSIVWAWESGLVLFPESIGNANLASYPWLLHFMQHGDQCLPAEERDGLLQSFLSIPDLPELVWPETWGLNKTTGSPQPVFKIKWPDRLPRDPNKLQLTAEILFRYANQDCRFGTNRDQKFFDSATSTVISRNSESELGQLSQLMQLEPITPISPDTCLFNYSDLTGVSERLNGTGWLIEAEGKPLTAPGHFSLEVNSGLDWFDLSGGATYSGQIVPLPVLLQAIRRKENFIRLDDGTHGMLPTEWMEKFGKFLELAEVEGNSLRFGKSQALLLDSLLADQDQSNRIQMDAGFRKFRQQLQAFDGIKPGQEPRSFQGALREYQRDGLGWFGFLQEFGFGGCLADDMGLGKTIQVLALLEQRRSRRLKRGEVRKPTLVVVPKSLIFNWIDEAAKFAPKLQVVDFTGTLRKDREHQLSTCHVVLTTYGTLRNDLEKLTAIHFDYAILDEAQAIKNPKTDAAKSCCLLRADHRLTMTGTPIENHLGDLWSQFRFLNPGLLGHSQAFDAFNRADCAPESLQQLSKAIRPFILRRTKQEVLQELPDKTEQTLFCEMNPKQARQYSELRNHYRVKLGQTVRELGIKRSKIHVLEALLRLRQAACDGRLVNAKQGARGAKLDLLLEQLEEVLGEGHKAIVFSQFTSLLGLLQKDLKQRKIRYEYLDGKTNDRKSPVQRFQTDDACQLFLISLKAGGHGLNLTAADYVYILDPWWNPAAEAQAIDRAHRIGQTKNVFAYRMIAKGTVEEKILELQKTKRELADSIISGNNSLIRTLTADDLQMLLG